MSMLKHGLLAAFVFIVSSSNLFAATVKKVDGAVVEGVIRGLIVQKAEVTTSTEGSEARFTTTYTLTHGSEIGAITEAGVTRASSRVVFALVTEKGAPPEDDVAIRGIIGMPSTVWIGSTETGGRITRIGGRSNESRGTNAHTLIGEFRQTEGKGRLIPALEVMTASGPITIPVKEIVAFKKKTENDPGGRRRRDTRVDRPKGGGHDIDGGFGSQVHDHLHPHPR